MNERKTSGQGPTGRIAQDTWKDNEPDDAGRCRKGGSGERPTGGKLNNNAKNGKEKQRPAGRKWVYLSRKPQAARSDGS
jgi:hypothetical protein